MHFNNNIHHDNCIPVVQVDVKAVSRPFQALGLDLACETSTHNVCSPYVHMYVCTSL